MKQNSFEQEKADGTYQAEEKDVASTVWSNGGVEYLIYMRQINHRVGPSIKGTSYKVFSKHKGINTEEEFWSFTEAVNSYLKINEFFNLRS
ncbi:hypothetical protein KAM546c_20080 [Enterobacter roggenkampii]|uniref:hypothetical protein n=1 Tax=Enterobacter roggenkampii TaxID=1812935 RepID=UPI001BDF7589|nr:hypothetical protein [Enterobacter roggenkampii]WCF39315.1 hypothetical protein KK030_17805 [Enterobacter roggenkampii]BDS20747.1 hypothetical protein KAM546c_20080 [Enterobacter roggenkampii]